MKRPFSNPEVELTALEAREVVLSEQIGELNTIGNSVPGTCQMRDNIEHLREQCRAAIRQFIIIHKLRT